MKGSPNVLLQTPKYDIRSNQILIPDLNEPLEEDGDVEGTSFLNGISLKIALFVLFLFLALLVLFSCILFWGLRARRLRARTVREHRSDEDLLENSQIDGPVVKSPLMKREQDDNITDNRTGDHHGFQFPHFSTFLRLKIDPREMQEIKPTSPTLTV